MLPTSSKMDSPQSSPPPPPSTLSIIPLLIAMFLLIIATLGLITIHYIVFRLCLNGRPRSNNNSSSSSPSGGVTTTVVGGGVDRKTLESIPVCAYTTRLGVSETVWGRQSECVVCLGEFEERDKVRVLPGCGHAFHAKCVDAWFLSQSSCPLCRAPVAAESGGSGGEGSSRLYTVHCPSWLV